MKRKGPKSLIFYTKSKFITKLTTDDNQKMGLTVLSNFPFQLRSDTFRVVWPQTLISLFKWDSCPIYLRKTICLLLGVIWMMMLTTYHSFPDWWVHFEKYKRALLSHFPLKSLGALPKITSLFIILMKLTPIQDSDIVFWRDKSTSSRAHPEKFIKEFKDVLSKHLNQIKTSSKR